MKKGDRILCPRCKGNGKVIDREMAVFTLGISALFRREGTLSTLRRTGCYQSKMRI